MLGLPDYTATQAPIAGDIATRTDLLPVFIDIPPFWTGYGGGGGGPTGPGPVGPIFPVGPGPIVIIIQPPGPPGPPTVITPVTPAPPSVPEPSAWAMMLAGMILVGGAMRRRFPGRVVQ